MSLLLQNLYVKLVHLVHIGCRRAGRRLHVAVLARMQLERRRRTLHLQASGSRADTPDHTANNGTRMTVITEVRAFLQQKVVKNFPTAAILLVPPALW